MLEIKDLTFSVSNNGNGNGNSNNGNGKRDIIPKLNYTFEKGKFYGITGPNGGGKTTLAKLIMGINQASSGEILLNGKNITELSISERANEGIAYSFQHPARFKGITFRELLSLAAGTDDDDSLNDIVAQVGICSMDFLDLPVDAKLSGGEIKKIEMAITIALEPKLAIYDEPDTGIDLWTLGPMVSLVKKEQQENDVTTIVVTHNKNFLEAADIVLILKEGRFVYEGDLNGALPLLDNLSTCCLHNHCDGEYDAKCYR